MDTKYIRLCKLNTAVRLHDAAILGAVLADARDAYVQAFWNGENVAQDAFYAEFLLGERGVESEQADNGKMGTVTPVELVDDGYGDMIPNHSY